MTGELELSCFGMIASIVPDMSAPPAGAAFRHPKLSAIAVLLKPLRHSREPASPATTGVDLKRVSTRNGKQRAQLVHSTKVRRGARASVAQITMKSDRENPSAESSPGRGAEPSITRPARSALTGDNPDESQLNAHACSAFQLLAAFWV